MVRDKIDKIDATFSRSRSSSCSSTTDQQQQQISIESIQCICFVDPSSNSQHYHSQDIKTATEQVGATIQLWLGTSHGAVLLVTITMPDSNDNRVLQLQSVIAVPTSTSIKLSGSILCLSTFQIDHHHQQQQQRGHSHYLPSSSSTDDGSQSTSQHSNAGTTSATTTGAAGGTTSQQLNKQDSASTFESPTSIIAAAAASTTTPTSAGHSTSGSPLTSGGIMNQQAAALDNLTSKFLVLVSEKHARVYQLPLNVASIVAEEKQSEKDRQQNCLAKIKLSESSFACKSAIVHMRQPYDESCLVTYLATGNILIHSLPKLRLLLDVDFVPLCNVRIASTLCFSRNGHGLYLSSASELSKFTISASYRAMVNDMIGSVYVPKDMPEMPRPNFFKALSSTLFSSSGKSSDRDELFSENSAGKASRGIARHIPGSASSGMDKLNRAAVGTLGHELRMAREGLDERGEKLSEIEDKTLQMMNQAENYGQTASQLVNKFKDKKWYQF